MEQAFGTGKLKIARHLTELRAEVRDYHYTEDGKKVEPVGDDLVSALRYAFMDQRYARVLTDATPDTYSSARAWAQASVGQKRGQANIAKGVEKPWFEDEEG